MVKLAGLAFLGLLLVGWFGRSAMRPGGQPPAGPDPAPAIAPAPVAPVPVPDRAEEVRFGLPESRRREINNAIWQAGMWATAEAERAYPLDRITDVGINDPDAGKKMGADRHALYLSRRQLGHALVAKRYGVGADVLTSIDQEGMDKKWQVSESPVLFDPAEGARAVLAAKIEVDPTTADETELRSIQERQRTIEIRNRKRAARRKNQ